MTDRDRLIELIKNAKQQEKYEFLFANMDTAIDMLHGEEYLADYLLANGVVVLPCKVGDSIFRVGNDEIWEWLIEHIEIFEDEIGFVDDGENYFTPDKIGQTVFLTKEEAEAELQKRGENNA